MPLGQSSRAISSPIGTQGATAPYGQATSGAANRRVRTPAFVPLSVFFLQLDGEGADGEDGEGKIMGFAKKPKPGKKGAVGKVNFDKAETHATRAMKGPTPEKKKEEWRDMEEDTVTANVPAYPVPIGRPITRATKKSDKERRRWASRLAKMMTNRS